MDSERTRLFCARWAFLLLLLIFVLVTLEAVASIATVTFELVLLIFSCNNFPWEGQSMSQKGRGVDRLWTLHSGVAFNGSCRIVRSCFVVKK